MRGVGRRLAEPAKQAAEFINELSGTRHDYIGPFSGITGYDRPVAGSLVRLIFSIPGVTSGQRRKYCDSIYHPPTSAS